MRTWEDREREAQESLRAALERTHPQPPKLTPEEASQANLQKMTKLCEEKGLQMIKWKIRDKKILSLLEKPGDRLDSKLLERLSQLPVLEFNSRPSCSHTSKAAIESGVATGGLTCEMEGMLLIVSGYHVINYSILPDGSFIAFDLTAFSHLDRSQGNYDILTIRAPSLEKLIKLVTDLYGGHWETIDLAGLASYS